ncbi:MAG: 16S rRNA (guanine(527)-N(7))-methyltransferase RsmG [Oscillospiraceae bacterium]|nr:16S rRNA (guanine(527)-N(7))-methyltransferase RsmG [Oscillospiraceae bacterium]
MQDKQRQYLDLVLETNRHLNLTAITNPAEAYVRHVEDSLALLDVCDFNGKRIIDVGAGGGFPGMPLAIACPGAHLTLLDATRKKVDFLRHAVETLGLANVDCLHARGEEAATKPPRRESYDISVSRGVARLDVLAELCLPFVKVGGVFIAMKQDGSEAAEAFEIVEALGGNMRDARGRTPYTLSDGTKHMFIIIEKIAATPTKYPRRWAKMNGKP